MPPVAAAIAGISFAKIAVSIAISVAFGFIQQALAPKPKAPKLSQDRAGGPQMIRSAVAPHQVVYGTAMVSGPLIFAEVSGTDNEFLHLIVLLAAHEIESIDSVFLNDVEITSGQLDGGGNVTSGRFKDHVRIKKHLGTDTQAADSDLVAEVANWTTAHQGKGIAYLYLRFKWNRDVFPTGIPNVKAVVRGRLVWDLRLDPGDPSVAAFSNNAALCQLDYLMSTFGFAVPLAEVQEASWVAAANICDEDVSIAAGGTQDRYTCDGSLLVDVKPLAIMDDLLSAAAGTMVYQQGTFRGYAAAATTATRALDESDLRGEIVTDPRPSRAEGFNAIRGTFISAADNYMPTDFPPITNAAFESEDNSERVFRDIELPFTTDKTRAQRIANLHLLRHRQGIVCTFPAKLTAFEIAAYDVVTVSIALLGWAGKEFRVLEWALAEEGGVDLILQEEASAVYAFGPGDEITVDPAPDTNLPDPFTVAPPTGLTLTSGTAALFLKKDGTVLSRIKAAWTAPADQFVIAGGKIEVQFKKSADGAWTQLAPLPGDTLEAFVWDVQDGVSYDLRVRSFNSLGVPSDTTDPWSATVTGHTVAGKTVLPANVTGFSAAQNGNVMNFRWTQVVDLDLAGYEIRFNPVGSTTWADATPLTEVTRGTAITNAMVPPGDWTFLIKAFDTSGNESASVASADAKMVAEDFDLILQVEQAPRWLGTLTNFVAHHTGVLLPESQDLASGNNFDVFDNFVVNPFATCTYEAPEFDIDFDDTVRVWGDIVSSLGPGETAGVANPALEIDYRKAADSYDGFEPWTIGNVEARFIKQRLVLTTATGLAKVTGFKPTVDLLERTEGAESVTIGAGGTAITFAKQFHQVPRVTVTVDSASALIPTKSGVTATGFTAHVYNTGGTEVGGTVDWEARGA